MIISVIHYIYSLKVDVISYMFGRFTSIVYAFVWFFRRYLSGEEPLSARRQDFGIQLDGRPRNVLLAGSRLNPEALDKHGRKSQRRAQQSAEV